MPIASNTIPARFARLVASSEDFEAAVLTCVTAVGAHLGRRSALIHNGYEVHSALYSLIVTQPSTVAAWYRWFRILEDAPPVTNSGIDRAEALVHLVRDRVLRPDKVITDRNADPEWRITEVDTGAVEKRHIIMQRLGPELVGRTSAAARRLRDTLVAGYAEGEMSSYVSYRDGGFHSVKGAHVALLISELDQRIAAAVCDQMPFLVARAENGPVCVDPSAMGDLVADLTEAVEATPSIITITPDVMSALQSESGSKRPYALLTLLRVAHVLTVLERGVVVTEAILLQARAIVEASESTLSSLHKGQRTLLRDEILEFVRTAGPEGLPQHKLVRRFRRRKNTSAADIKAALAALEREQKLIYELAETRGRYRGEWHSPRVK